MPRKTGQGLDYPEPPRAKATSVAMSIADRRRQAAELYLKGQYQSQIARTLGVHHSVISRDLTAVRKLWTESTLLDFDEVMAQELAKIDNLERTYWEAWDKSNQEVESRTSYLEPDPDTGRATPARAAIHTAPGMGDSRFLLGVQWCIDQRCRIFGIYGATKVSVSWQDDLKKAGFDEDSAGAV